MEHAPIRPSAGRGPIRVVIHEHVTGGGLAGRALPESWAIEGAAMRRTLAAEFAAAPGVEATATLDDRFRGDPGAWTTVKVGPGSEASVLAALAASHDYTLIIAPETDGVLARLSREVRRGGRLLGSTPAAIEATGDKLRLSRRLLYGSIPTPRSRLVDPSAPLPADVPYPAVLKPVDGAGAVDTVLVRSPDDPRLRRVGRTRCLIQPYCPGEPRSALFLIGATRGPILLCVGRQRVRCDDDGRFAYEGGVLLDEPLAPDHPARRAVAAVDGLAGLVGVDYVEDDRGAATVIEINPRPTTSIVGLAAVVGPGAIAAAWLGRGELAPDGCFPVARPRQPLEFRADGSLVDGGAD